MEDRQSIYRLHLQPMLRNFPLVVALVVTQSAVYWVLNQYQVRPSRTLPITAVDRAIPFWIWTVWPYFGLHVLGVLFSLSVRDRIIFRRLVVSYAVSIVPVAMFFILWPTHCIRPEPPGDPSLSSVLYRWLISVDTPECCFPSAHIIPPVLACAALWQDRRHGGIWPSLITGVCLLTILTTKQHYVWDLLGSLAITAVGIAVSRRLVPDSRRSADSPPDVVR